MKPQPGTIYLVGAGPGDPKLITVHGREVLESADAVVHDRLVSAELLKLARAGARMENVGKAPGRASRSQSEINDLLVRLEPGMAFGTGLHPTTRLCVAALEEWVQPGDSFLDVGTGSGVLSIVAAKLGARPVWATDIDPLAIRAAKENALRNGIALAPGIFRVEQGSIPAGQTGRFNVIAANILAEVLVGLFDETFETVTLAEPLAPGGRLILSGILEEKAKMVLSAAARHGLKEVERRREADWVSLVVRSENAG